MTLSPAEVERFKTFGFLLFPGFLGKETAEVTEAFERLWKSLGGGHSGKPHDGRNRSCVVRFLEQDSRLSSLLDDPRVEGIASSLVGADYNYAGSDGNFYAGDTGWHSDNTREAPVRIKFIFYLDPLGKDSGALRVIPGSHRWGEGYSSALHSGSPDPATAWGLKGPEVPCQVLESKPGDLIVFNQNLKHASFGGGARRRMFTMNFHERFAAGHLPQLFEFLRGEGRFLEDRFYFPEFVRSAGPGRRRHLEQILEHESVFREASREERRHRKEPSRG